MILTNEEIMQINQTAEFDSAIGYARKIEQAVLESYKAELLNEVGEPTCRVSTTGIITNQTNAPLEPGLELYTADQLIAARKGLEEEIERLSERRCEICGYAEHHREHASCLRTQLAAAQEEIADLKNTIKTRDFEVETLYVRRGESEELKKQLATAEQRVAEACALTYLEDYDLTDIAERVRAGEWRKFVKEV